jgi:DNA processing protein
VGAPYSEGCNQLIRSNGASLLTCADEFVKDMGWQTDAQLQQAQAEGIERDCFPNLTDEEQKIAKILDEFGDFQLNQLSVKSNIPIGQLTALLFQMEMKGVIRSLAGGTYHLMK